MNAPARKSYAAPELRALTEGRKNFVHFEVMPGKELPICLFFMGGEQMRGRAVTASQAEWIGAWFAQELPFGVVTREPIAAGEEHIDLVFSDGSAALFIGSGEIRFGRDFPADRWFRVARDARGGEKQWK